MAVDVAIELLVDEVMKPDLKLSRGEVRELLLRELNRAPGIDRKRWGMDVSAERALRARLPPAPLRRTPGS